MPLRSPLLAIALACAACLSTDSVRAPAPDAGEHRADAGHADVEVGPASRRGGPATEAVPGAGQPEEMRPLRGLAELTLERRAQGRPDPLTVEVRFLSEGPYIYPELPVLGVRLLHTQGETEWFELEDGGDYRSGRLARWDLLLTSADGRPHAGVDNWQALMGGWMSSRVVAKPGFVWGFQDMLAELQGEVTAVEPVPLPLSAYRKPTELGRFSVRAVYSDAETIADMDEPSQGVVFTSQPLEFEWQPRVIPRDGARDLRIDRAIGDLLRLEETVVTGFSLEFHRGDPREEAHPLERLFAEGYAAVEALRSSAHVEVDPILRAKLCAALVSLTGIRPDRWALTSVVGNHQFLGSPMPAGSGVSSSAPRGRSTGGRLSEAEQARYLAQIDRFMAPIQFEAP